MASNIPVVGWIVNIFSLPVSITATKLAEEIGLPSSRVRISKPQENDTRFAQINGFISEVEAKTFARQWSNSLVFGKTIKCAIAALKSGGTDGRHSPRTPVMPSIEPLSNKQNSPMSYRAVKGRVDISTPPTTRGSPISTVTSRITSAATDNDENKSAKPPSSHSSRTLKKQQENITGKLSYVYH